MTMIIDETETTVLSPTLSAEERSTLTDLEIVIGNGMESFMQVGEALTEIRNGRLYRESHKSFAEYVMTRWPRIGSRRNADRLISSFEVEQSIRAVDPELTVGSERVARELTPVPAPQRAEVLREAQTVAKAAGREAPTSRDVRTVVEQRQGGNGASGAKAVASVVPSLPARLPGGLPVALPSALPAALPAALPSTLPARLPGGLPAPLPGAAPMPASTPTPAPTTAPTKGELDELRRAVVLAALMRSATEEAEERLAALRRRYPSLQSVELTVIGEQVKSSVTPLLNNPGLNITLGFLALHGIED